MANETTTDTEAPWSEALLVLPRLRVQNANAISSPMTWGFPAITAFIGFMQALERRLGPAAGIRLLSVGVVCHHFDPQVTTEGYTRSFRLTRNPAGSDGNPAAIVEEGRVHLDLTLVFNTEISPAHLGEDTQRTLAQHVADLAAGMRMAGGSVLPASPPAGTRPQRPSLHKLGDDTAERASAFRMLARRWLPGFALVSRDDLLQDRLAELQQADPGATALDAWLSLSRWTSRATPTESDGADDTANSADWSTDKRQGWTVPIPVGYAALSERHAPGSVANARDGHTPLRFVESVYSIGQWVSPHRLRNVRDLLWRDTTEPELGLYRCVNDYRPPAPSPASPPASTRVNTIESNDSINS